MKIFYSWQSDLPNATNRGLIGDALEKATKSLRADESVDVEPVVDRDTLGVPGATDIKETILAKINQCDIFVADVSIIHPRARKPAPNPNVLYELGYAVRKLTMERVILVQNTTFGRPEDLPFDLRGHLVLTYRSRKEDTTRAEARNFLSRNLEAALRTILNQLIRDKPPPEPFAQDWTPAIRRYREVSTDPYVSVAAIPGKAASVSWDDFRTTAIDKRLVIGNNMYGWPAFSGNDDLEWLPTRGVTVPFAPEYFWEVCRNGSLLFCSTQHWKTPPLTLTKRGNTWPNWSSTMVQITVLPTA